LILKEIFRTESKKAASTASTEAKKSLISDPLVIEYFCLERGEKHNHKTNLKRIKKMSDFLLSDVRCYTQKSPAYFSNLCFYFTFGYKVERFSFITNHPPHSKKFRSELLTYLREKIEKCKDQEIFEDTALSLYLAYLERCDGYSAIMDQLPIKGQPHFSDLMDYIERLENSQKKALPEIRLLFRIQESLSQSES
jgi:hypothetical protein